VTIATTVFRQRLLDETVQITEALAQANDASHIVELDQSAIGRVSRIDALQQQAMALGMHERLLIRQRQIEAALARMEDDSFGSCCACGALVEPDRLDADPAAVCCMPCAEVREPR
jgi:DnaK suppressor protein